MSFDLVFVFPDISGPTGDRDHYTVPIGGDDQQVFVIIIPYRLGGVFVCIRYQYNDLRKLGVCKVCKRHA